MAFLVDIHGKLANMVSLYALLVGFWGLFNGIRRRPPDGNYNGALALGVGLFVVEGIVGVVLVILGYMPARAIHRVEGASGAVGPRS